MADETGRFGDTAQRLARNPLGIIALFIVLVYGLAALVTAFSGSLSSAERLPLIYFLVVFPILVLGVFAWLVSRHSNKLFSPRDFQNEENYVKMLSATASLAVASVKSETTVSEETLGDLVRTVRESAGVARTVGPGPHAGNRILWVDDRPENNIHERRAMEAMGLVFTLALSTGEALDLLSTKRFAAIISDMGRKEGPDEGYVLLESVRRTDKHTPFFIYSSSNAPEHRREARSRGAQSSTNDPQELFGMVMRAVVNPAEHVS
ncbi:MAG TPA: response regulator [Actinophytocola sp.]|uniref:response regulator n=1 Tax=Actinophytocola sp. TaxID=1872138 RepID=UPI002DDC90CB|nr:response regulator [Actinophytocola sp.]HEV2783317.1 response regulator [Actinophytocola sp.]